MRQIPVNAPLLDGNERRYVMECLDTGWISSEGPFVRRFEESFASMIGRRAAIAVCNGSAALELALVALKLQPGDEVIVPSFTIISCAAAVVRAQAVPVFVDCESTTWNVDVQKIESAISSRTRAILVAHIYGLPSDMDPILELARRHRLAIVEDAAEAHGLMYRGRMCGSFGEISTFSFYSNKHVTTGEGGLIAADDPEIIERCRKLRNLAFDSRRRFFHEELGWNYRLSNVQAAIGFAQIETLGRHIEVKRALGRKYRAELSELAIETAPVATNYAENDYWVFGLVLKDSVPFDAAEAMRRLAERGIGTRPFFWPMHEQPVLRQMGLGGGPPLPVSERIARRGFYLPSGLGLTSDDIDYVVSQVKAILSPK
jgi:perosamine synthetase